MEATAVGNLYKEYLDNALGIKYKKVTIERESLQLEAKKFLKSLDGDRLTDSFNELIELEHGKYYLGIKNGEKVENVFFDDNGREINRLEDVYIDKFHDGIARVRTKGSDYRRGYVDVSGKLISDIKWGFDSGEFKSGRARVMSMEGESRGRYGYIDRNGVEVLPCLLTNCTDFYDGVACKDSGGLKTFFDENGNELFSDVLVSPVFNEDMVVYDNKKGKKGYKNRNGEVQIRAQYRRAGHFNNGIASVDDGHVDLNGRKVKVESLPNGVLYIKGFRKNIYYNKLKKTYEKFDAIPYRDEGDYLLLVADGKFQIYSKESGLTTQTEIKYESSINDFTLIDNVLCINGYCYYLKPSGFINLSDFLDIGRIVSCNSNADIMDYEQFETRVRNDSNFYQRLLSDSKALEEERLKQDIANKRSSQDQKRQEIIEQLSNLKNALKELNESNGKLSKIDQDMLLYRVEDHLEINPEFVDQLAFLDLSYIDFANVLVRGVNFDGSNASIDPQTVYQKDMSNASYRGLNFVSRNFNGVKINGSSFEGCNMDFAILAGAITEDVDKDSGKKAF